MVTIVKATSTDVDLLARLGPQTFIESHGHSAGKEDVAAYISNAYNIKTCQQELSDTNNIYHLIYNDNQPAGFSKIILDSPAPGVSAANITKLERIYILKEFYGQQSGLALLNFNIELSKSHKQAGMWLYTWVENDRAVNFYKKAGFHIIGSYDFKISDTHSNLNHRMFLKY